MQSSATFYVVWFDLLDMAEELELHCHFLFHWKVGLIRFTEQDSLDTPPLSHVIANAEIKAGVNNFQFWHDKFERDGWILKM